MTGIRLCSVALLLITACASRPAERQPLTRDDVPRTAVGEPAFETIRPTVTPVSEPVPAPGATLPAPPPKDAVSCRHFRRCPPKPTPG